MVLYGIITSLLGYVIISLILLFFCFKKWRLRWALSIFAGIYILIGLLGLYLREDHQEYILILFLVGVLMFIVGQLPGETRAVKQ